MRVRVALGALLVVGVGLRLWMTLAWRPALIGFPDTGPYLEDAAAAPFWDPLRMVGYGYVLRAMHAVAPSLTAVVVVQHALGVVGAALLYGAVRRFGAPSGVALVAAAVVLLGGDEIVLEHAVLSEAPFTFLVLAGIYAAARVPSAGPRPSLLWGALAAGAFALATTLRLVGLALVPLACAWLLFARGRRPDRAALAAAATALVVAIGILGGYRVLHHAETGSWAFTISGAYNLYGRVAPFAKCGAFDPPPGTRGLCERSDPRVRPGPDFYNFDARSPAARAFGGSAQSPPPPADLERISDWSRQVVLHQPRDYLVHVARDLARLVAPESFVSHSGDPTNQLVTRLLDERATGVIRRTATRLYGPLRQARASVGPLRSYERVTRVQGPLMVVLWLLALAAPLVATGPARRGAVLLLGVAVVIVLVPILTVFYDARYMVPAYGPLAAAAALGGWGLVRRFGR